MLKPALTIWRRPRKSVLPLFLLLSLIGCGISSRDVGKPNLPGEPPGLKTCTDEVVPALPGPRGTAWSNAQANGIIGDQRASALGKNRCTHDWRSYYADLRKRLAQ